LSFDISIYYINWRNIQITVTDPVSFDSYFINASSAKSEGVELSAKFRPFKGTTIASWVAWNEAVLNSDLPINQGSAIGHSGDSLPYSSRWSGNLSADYEVNLAADITGFAGVSASYVGERQGTFSGNFSAQRSIFPSYIKTDFRIGARRSG